MNKANCCPNNRYCYTEDVWKIEAASDSSSKTVAGRRESRVLLQNLPQRNSPCHLGLSDGGVNPLAGAAWLRVLCKV